MSTPLLPEQQRYWDRYLRSLAEDLRPAQPRVTAGPAGTPDVTDDLLALYLSRSKTAGSSLVADFITARDPLPDVGDFWICLDSAQEPRCILRTTRVERHRFDEVPESIARAEGEGDGSLEHWRRVHAELYGPSLSSWGIERIDEAEVITEFFTIVFQEPAWPATTVTTTKKLT